MIITDNIQYRNGNVDVTISSDGTKVRQFDGAQFVVHPETIDVKITNYCDAGCAFCHENSTVSGVHGNLKRLKKILSDLPMGVELAIGGGNPLSHPDLLNFLFFCKDRFIVNLTVNQKHLKSHEDLLQYLVTYKLVNAIGISITNSKTIENDMDYLFAITKNIVFHVIAGVHGVSTIDELAPYKYPILVLGYKLWGRGVEYSDRISGKNHAVWEKVKMWKIDIPRYLGKVHLCFDNLAVEQLELQKWFDEETWSKVYLGEDFTVSMYIDAVLEQFAPTSRDPYRISWDKMSLEEFFNEGKAK